MTLHIAANTGCNLGCTYCYEEPDREIKQKQIDNEYDIEKIMGTLEEWAEEKPYSPPGMHGGEPLLLRKEHLDRIFSFIIKNWEQERTHIQTNGTLIDADHIAMFKKYNVNVGISCDGPLELNRERIARGGGKDVTDHMSARTLSAIEELATNGVGVGIITVLHKGNAGDDEKLGKLLDWMDDLNQMGVKGHYNPAIPYEETQDDLSLSPSRLAEVFVQTWEWMKEPGQNYREWNPFRDMQNNLLGLTLSNCIANKCDVYNAGAAQILKGDGEQTGCGKTWAAAGDGVPFLQGESSNNEYNDRDEMRRYDMLKQVPGPFTPDYDGPDLGGLRGWRYWTVNQGGCPSSGMDFDYRTRSIWTDAYDALYERIEHDMRRMMPGIRLITDLPWDAPVSDEMAKNGFDIFPFANMDLKTTNHPSVTGKSTTVEEPHKLLADSGKLNFAEVEQLYNSKYGPENVTSDPETGDIHADIDHSK